MILIQVDITVISGISPQRMTMGTGEDYSTVINLPLESEDRTEIYPEVRKVLTDISTGFPYSMKRVGITYPASIGE